MKKIATILFATLLMACNNVEKEDLTIIDNIQLAVNADSLNKQFYKNKILQKALYTKTFFEDVEELDQNKIFFQLSTLFDFPDFKNQYINHYGAYLPTAQEGTDNIIGLNILLGHGGNASLLNNKYGVIDITKETNLQAFNQTMRTDLINKIEKMLIEKYGNPIKTVTENSIQYFVIEGKKVPEYGTNKDFKGEALLWETKNLNIILFKGIPNYNAFYNTEIDGYSFLFEDNSKTKKVGKGDILCNSYPYISYQLKKETIKKLKLDEVNL